MIGRTKLIVLGLLVAAHCAPATAVDYYVNDSSTNGDVYCYAPGDNSNAGTNPASPKANVQRILDVFGLGDTHRHQ